MSLNVAFSDVQIGNTPTPIMSAGANTQLVILAATATNTDGSAAHTLTLFRVPQGGSAGATNILGADVLPIAPNTTIDLPISGQVLISMAALQAQADVGAFVNVNVSYAITTPS